MHVKGNVIIDFTPPMIKFLFHMADRKNPRQLNEAKVLKLYIDNKERNRLYMNKTWMRVDKKSLTKLPD